MQTVYKVTNARDTFFDLQYTNSGRACKTKLGVMCTAQQKIEIEFLFDFYKRVWEKEKTALLEAFFQKHNIFGELKDGEQPSELAPEDIIKLNALIKGLSDEQPIKQIEGKNENWAI